MRSVSDVLQRSYDAFIAKLQESACTLPTRSFIATGQVVPDCDQFAIIGGTIYQGVPGIPATGYQSGTGGVVMYAMDIAASITRCFPSLDSRGAAPKAQALTDASLGAAADAQALSNAYMAAVADGTLVDPCDSISFGGVEWDGPQGGAITSILTFSIQL